MRQRNVRRSTSDLHERTAHGRTRTCDLPLIRRSNPCLHHGKKDVQVLVSRLTPYTLDLRSKTCISGRGTCGHGGAACTRGIRTPAFRRTPAARSIRDLRHRPCENPSHPGVRDWNNRAFLGELRPIAPAEHEGWGNIWRRQWSINSRSSRGLRHPAMLLFRLRWECC